MRKNKAIAVGALILALSLLLATCFARVNTTASMPLGFWIRWWPPVEVKRGQIVIACLPPDPYQARYLGAGFCPTGNESVLKFVAAVPGDRVEASDQGLSVNGTPLPHTDPMVLDGAGREIRHLVGEWNVAPGSVWLMAPDSKSFDSRYFGPIPARNILGLAIPVWTWR